VLEQSDTAFSWYCTKAFGYLNGADCLINCDKRLYLPSQKKNNVMAVTQLARKKKVNRSRSAQRKQSIKLLTAKPVLKNIDIEVIKKEFEAKKASAKPAAKKKVEELTPSAE
jgi:hypothetical protein